MMNRKAVIILLMYALRERMRCRVSDWAAFWIHIETGTPVNSDAVYVDSCSFGSSGYAPDESVEVFSLN